jgi:cytochrome c oxidase assembly factor CtaG
MGTALGAAGSPGLTGALASGYHGPPELTVTRALTEWTFDPWMLALIVLLGACYLTGVRRVRAGQAAGVRRVRAEQAALPPARASAAPASTTRASTAWPVARPIWFCGLGLGFLVIATMSWVSVYQSVLLYPRAVQTVLLVLVVPLFLALGRPLTLFATVFPGPGARLEAVIRSRAARILTFPAITTLALVAVPFVMYFTSWYTAVFHSGPLREVTYLILMVPGYVFFWTLLRVDPVPKEYPYVVSMWITGAEVIGDAFFGIAVIADQNLIGAGYFHALARPWGPTLATDQVVAGGVLWILGDLVGLPFLAAQLIHLMREDESDAARIDAELDAQQAQLDAERAQQSRLQPATHPAASARHPGAPGQSAAPGQPAALGQSADSGQPAALGQSADSGQPRVPGQSAHPDESVDPGQSRKPGQSAESATSDQPADEQQPQGSQLWWENDPRFTSRFKPTS